MRILRQYCAAVYARKLLAVFQLRQIAANGFDGYVKSLAQLRYSNRPVCVQHVDNDRTPFVNEQIHTTPINSN